MLAEREKGKLMDIGGTALLVLVVVAVIGLVVGEIVDGEKWRKTQTNNLAMAEARRGAIEAAFNLTGGSGSYQATGPNGDQIEIRTWNTFGFFLFNGSGLMNVRLKLKSLQVSGSSEAPPEYRYRFRLRRLDVLRGQTVVGNPRPVPHDGVATVQELAKIEMYLRTWPEFHTRARHN